MAHLVRDLRFAWRSFRRTPGAAGLAIATLAIGIGANAAIFSVIHSVLIDPLPYRNADRLVLLWRQNPAVGGVSVSPSRADADRWRGASTIEALTTSGARALTLDDGAEPEQVIARIIEPNIFDMLGVRPQIGRPFAPEDIASEPASRVVILGDGVWRRRFGGSAEVIGRTVSLTDQPYTIVGVMPRGFRLPLGKGDVWIPMAPPAAGAKTPAGGVTVLARVKAGAPVSAIEAELTAKMGESEMRGVPGRWQAHIMLPGELAGPTFRRALLILLGAVAFVLLIGCANIAALLLARNASRRREIAVRTALGASRARLIRQLLTESLLLAAIGGAAGLLLGVWILQALTHIRPADMEQLANVTLDPQMFAVAAALAIVTGVLFGLAPAVSGVRMSLNEGLKQTSRLMSHRHGTFARRALTAAEIALACVLLVGAGLLIRSYGHLIAASPGFQPERRIAMRVALPESRYSTPAARGDFFARLLAQVQGLPDVHAAALAAGVPPRGGLIFGTVEIEGQPHAAAAAPSAFAGGSVGPGFFRTLGIPIVRGREFADTDRGASVTIVNDTAAKRWWPQQDPIGKRLRLGARSAWMTVVGVAGDLSSNAAYSDVQVYDLLQPENMQPDATLVAMTSGEPEPLAGALKGEVWSIDPRVPVTDITTLTQAMAETMSRPRFNMLLLTAFALTGLVLAAIGIYGVISYSVGLRTPEIGLRMALGALPRDIRRSVVAEAVMMAAVGLAVGIGAAIVLTRLMRSLLFEVSTFDVASFAGTVLVLALTALAAAWIPARRAMRVDPMIALRAE